MQLVPKSRDIKGYKSMSKEKLLSAFGESESAGSGNNFNNARTKKIRKDFNKLRNRYLKLKIKEIRRNLYEIECEKNLSKSETKEMEQNLIELEESLFKLNKYYGYDDIEYKEIRDVRNLFKKVAFNQSTDEDYYKSIKTNSAFNGNYIEYQSKGDKYKNLSPKEYFNMIRPHLSDIINYHKTPKNLSVHSWKEVIDCETQYGEWKIQLTMSINFIFSEDSDGTRSVHTKSDNEEIIMGSEANDIIEKLYESLLQKYQEGLEESMKGSEFICGSVALLYYNLQKISLNRKGSSYVDFPKSLKNKKSNNKS